jgi:hypothetical protein
MLIEDYKRIDGWLNIRVNPVENQSLYDFSEYQDGKYHTLSEAYELYNHYINYQPERLSEKDRKVCDSPNTPTKGSEPNRND